MMAADLYGDIAPPPETTWRDYVPGLIVAALATLAAAYLSEHYGAPLTLMSLLIGLALNFLGHDKRLRVGLGFASRTLLRSGIVLVGARVTLGDMLALGPEALIAILLIVALTMGAGVAASRALGQGSAFGALAGGAVAICGASAALALATTLGERRAGQARLALVLVGISAASSLAMVAYPAFALQLGLSDRAAGFMLGAAIHDVAQALGAGYSYSTEAGETAAIVKLARVALLAPVLAIVALFLPRGERGTTRGIGLPWFVVGFFLVAAANSMGAVPAAAGVAAGQAAAALLACAVAATGILSPMGELLKAGPKPLLVIALATSAALALSAGAALLLLG
ncbi:MAG: hypothetical protein AVDCRST_MAG39-740 [uncultured Sphingomonadaceae bacterium]|uniref:Sulfate exporter family transporter n=1 Tax=uncultured Sphingomonadaceae bacterium TaxID=169976 RepID=A0A6J4SEY7_9SPHN|nr:MAG: hypothetical protein AVDCRST_MAG39-740 [uncultured Sphingomonadaceae bacterium]